MRWVWVLVVLLASCAAPQSDVDERSDVELSSLLAVNGSEFSYELIECADDYPIFGGAFIPFEVSVAQRSTIVDEYDFEELNESCVRIVYELDRDLREDLLGAGTLSVTIDPRDTINESDESNNARTYEPDAVCIDSDGDNPFLSSFVTARIDSDSIYILDRCANATATEYACDGSGRIEPILYNCSEGCVSGSCRCANSATCLTDGSATRI